MKNKYMKNILITALIYITAVFILWLSGFSLAKASSDYLNQHTVFLDYLRQNFAISHDIFPQWLMNFGLGQSFVTLFYYGMYNPFIVPFYVVPNLNPVYVFETITLVLIMINTAAMTKLLELNEVDEKLSSVIAVMSSFSGVFLFHTITHPMFIYYLPIFTFSLVSLHYLQRSQIRGMYILTVGLIFFTNFTFAPVISILQFFYFVFLLIENNRLKFKPLFNFFSSYLLGVLLGAMILLPTILFVTQSSGRSEVKNLDLKVFNDLQMMVGSISADSYSSGIFIVGLVGLLGTLIFVRQKRYKLLAIMMLVFLVFEPMNIALNLFQYVHNKVYIMFVPILWLLFAKVIMETNKRQLLILFANCFILYIIANQMYLNVLYMTLAVLVFILFTMLFIVFKPGYKVMIIPTLVFVSFATSVRVTANYQLSIYENSRNPVGEPSPYRVSYTKQNYIDNMSEMNPILYTSLENSEYIQAVKHEYEVPAASFERRVLANSFDNLYFQNMFAIKTETIDSNPIAYGVAKEDSYNLEEYQKLDENEKLYAANQALFTLDTDNQGYQNNFEIQPIYQNSDSITIDSDYQTSIPIPSIYQDGIMTITFDASLIADDSQLQRMWINDQKNDIQYADYYGLVDNSTVTFIINTTDITDLDIEVEYEKGEPIEYSNLQVMYQSRSDFVENKLPVTAPSNFKVDLNDSFDFDLDMDDTGYLATTIPYDQGFKILVDGSSVPVIKINDLYIGAKLNSGSHHIEIEYQIPGFYAGVIITFATFIITVIIIGFDIRKYRN